ncbi:hypothetical protein [Ferrimicrobium acidiphilum]|uniref:hypothetical protein n=1 Tax=Ferrimicrobium acidiphilum TaxID=121039 RepID=UPI0023F0A4EE|nr:hypothetical protein [Ferrimicrobium acidiphilum]
MNEVQSPISARAPGSRPPGLGQQIYVVPMFTTLLAWDLWLPVSWHAQAHTYVSQFTALGPGETRPSCSSALATV